MNRRSWLAAIGGGGLFGITGCFGVASLESEDSQQVTTVRAGTETTIDLNVKPMSDVAGPRIVTILNAGAEKQSHDAAVTITTPELTLFDGKVSFEEPTEYPTQLTVRLFSAEEYTISVRFDGEDERSEAITVSEAELASQRNTITAFRYEDELTVTTSRQQTDE